MEDTRTWSYREVLQQVEALTSYLNSLDFPRGSRIAILSENRYEWVVVYLAVVALGLIAVPLDAQATLKEWALILRHSEACLLFCSEKLEGHFSKMPKGLEGLERIAFGERFEEILRRNAGGLNEEECPPVGESDVATLVFTSGTTGTPKGVLLSHGNLLNSAREMGTEYSDEGGIAASILPFNHIYGFAVLTSRIHRGHSLAIFRTVSEPLIFEALARLRPYTLAGVPLLFERMGRSIKERLRKEMPKFAFHRIEKLAAGSWGLDADAWRSIKRRVFAKVHAVFGGRMTHFASGGAPMDVDLVRFFQTLGIAICQGYGLTETGPLITMGRRKTSRPGAVGLPVGGMSVKIDNPDLNGVGEILVKGQGVMQGYFRKPEETAKVIDGGGWFRTGDLGRWDEHGCLHISGRLKEMIVTSNGKKIYPADHFALYESIHGVREACLFGVPDRFGRGEVVHLHIFPDPDLVAAKGRDAVVSEIKEGIAVASGQLPEYQRPSSVGFSEEAFPRSASLKIKKHEVKKAWLESRHKAGPPHADSGNHKAGDLFLHSEASQVVLRILKSLMPHPVAINTSTSLELDLWMDSLAQIEFWSTLEKSLNVKIPEDAVSQLKVVGHIIEYLLENTELGEKAHETLKEISQKSAESTVGSWFEILGNLSPQQQETADRIVASCPRARPLFLRVFRFLFGKLCGLEFEGIENLPSSGGYILAPNHECHIDNIFVASLLPKETQKAMAVIGKKEHFDRWFTRLFAKLCHAIPVDRGQVSSSVLQIASHILRRGGVMLIHPEGTRSPGGELLPYKVGAALLADYNKCPIIPVHIEGAHEFWPKDALLPRRFRKITVTFDKPLIPVQDPSPKTRIVQKAAQVLTKQLRERALQLRMMKKAKPGDFDGVRNGSRYL